MRDVLQNYFGLERVTYFMQRRCQLVRLRSVSGRWMNEYPAVFRILLTGEYRCPRRKTCPSVTINPKGTGEVSNSTVFLLHSNHFFESLNCLKSTSITYYFFELWVIVFHSLNRLIDVLSFSNTTRNTNLLTWIQALDTVRWISKMYWAEVK